MIWRNLALLQVLSYITCTTSSRPIHEQQKREGERASEFPTDLSVLVNGTELGGASGAQATLYKVGEEQYVKKTSPAGKEDFMRNEFLANVLINAASQGNPKITAPTCCLYDQHSTPAMMCKFVDDFEGAPKQKPDENGTFKIWSPGSGFEDGFVLDALMENNDLFGNEGNVGTANDHLYRMDNGASLEFTAKGERRPEWKPEDKDPQRKSTWEDFPWSLWEFKTPMDKSLFPKKPFWLKSFWQYETLSKEDNLNEVKQDQQPQDKEDKVLQQIQKLNNQQFIDIVQQMEQGKFIPQDCTHVMTETPKLNPIFLHRLKRAIQLSECEGTKALLRRHMPQGDAKEVIEARLTLKKSINDGLRNCGKAPISWSD